MDFGPIGLDGPICTLDLVLVRMSCASQLALLRNDVLTSVGINERRWM